MAKIRNSLWVAYRRLNNNPHAASGKHEIECAKYEACDSNHKPTVGRKFLSE